MNRHRDLHGTAPAPVGIPGPIGDNVADDPREAALMLSNDCMLNIQDEAQAIQSYNSMIYHVQCTEIAEEDKEQIIGILQEIINDELDHIRLLKGIYSGNFTIKPDAAPEVTPVIVEGITPSNGEEDDQ